MSSVIILYLWRELLLLTTRTPEISLRLVLPSSGRAGRVFREGLRLQRVPRGAGGGQTASGRLGVRVWSHCQGSDLCCFLGLFLMFFPWKMSACCSLMSAWLYGHLLQMSNSVSLPD